MQITEATLAALPGFRDLDPETYAAVEAISRIIEVPAESVLCRQGNAPDMLHYLLDGQVTLSQATPGGDVAVVDVLRPIRGIGLADAVTGQNFRLTARSVTPSRLMQVRAAPLRSLIDLRPCLATTMLRGLSFDLDAVTRQVVDLKLHTATERLAVYLLRLVHGLPGNRAEFRLPVQKRLLAAQLGCRQENLSRAFGMLREYGVETHGGRVILHDIDHLRRYAGPAGLTPEPETAPDPLRSVRAFSEAFSLR